MASLSGRFAPPTTHVTQGEVRVSTDADQCFTTILGSCVATVIYDPVARVGGVNHLLLPSTSASDPANIGHDVNLMELLINGVLQKGGQRGQLKAKMFGGAQMINGLGAMGAVNSSFVSQFLRDENIPCVTSSLGGTTARRLRFWPASGRVQQKQIPGMEPAQRDALKLGARARALRLSGVELL